MINKIIQGDCVEVMKTMSDNSVDSIVTDPPYGLEFMGKEWDKFGAGVEETSTSAGGFSRRGKEKGDNPFANARIRYGKKVDGLQEFCTDWATECLRVLKPGGYLLSFGGSRTYHRMASGIEDAGFEIRDQIMWLYGSGFPKSLNIGKAVDKIQGNKREDVADNPNHRKSDALYELGFQGGKGDGKITKGNSQWEGWGTALKPAHEPIVVARKPLSEKTVAKNVLKWGTGGINIDATRIGYSNESDNRIGTEAKAGGSKESLFGGFSDVKNKNIQMYKEQGRFPANIILECTCDELKEGKEEVAKNVDFENVKQSDMGWGTNKCITKNQTQNYKIHTNPNCPCKMLDEQSGESKSPKAYNYSGTKDRNKSVTKGFGAGYGVGHDKEFGDKGGASRFFYCAKASKSERNMGLGEFEEKDSMKWSGGSEKMQGLAGTYPDGTPRPIQVQKNNHPTVKPVKLMEYLVRLVTPKGGIVLDPFIGSGTTAIACVKEGMKYIGIERDEEYIKIAEARIKAVDNKLDL